MALRLVDSAGFNFTFRTKAALVVCAAVLLSILIRLWYLQIVQGDFFRDRSENNRKRVVYIPPPRGVIFDRHGKVLVQNRASFNVEFVSEDCPNPQQTISDLADLLGEPRDLLLERLRVQRKRRRFEPKLLLKDVSRDVVAKVVSHRYMLPGVIVNVNPARHYLYDSFASHVLGYIREISREQLEADKRFQGQGYVYLQGDLVGQYGIESVWERDLQGQRGFQEVVVNANGVRISEASFEPEIPGNSIYLSIDYDVQAAADQALQGKKGAIVALSPRTGDILALASGPSFNPNLFIGEVSAADWNQLVMGKDRVLSNRVAQGAFPPGSVFKVFMAAAALSEGVINTRERVNCPGYYRVGARRFRCHKKEGHGPVDLEQALVKSCDVYFYTVGQRLGVDRIHDYAKRFGLGLLSGLELVTERAGLVPSTEWKRTHFKKPEMQKWYPGETPSVAIGQGAVTLTPLQIARGLAAVVNGGTLYRPRIVLGGEASAGRWRADEFGVSAGQSVNIDPEILKIVVKALEGVVYQPGGTGRRAQLAPEFDVKVGGKTGTAQVVGMEHGARGEEFQDHAWFAGFAPVDNPEIVVVALAENGGHGGVAAAPMVKPVMEAYFRKQCQIPGEVCRMKPVEGKKA